MHTRMHYTKSDGSFSFRINVGSVAIVFFAYNGIPINENKRRDLRSSKITIQKLLVSCSDAFLCTSMNFGVLFINTPFVLILSYFQ